MKKNLYLALVTSFSILVLDYFKVQDVCSFSCSRNFDGLFLNWFAISMMVSAFLLVLNFLPQRVYEAWWRFTKFALPILITVVSVQIYTINLPRGGYQVLNFDLEILAGFYAVYILLSFIQIYRGYRSK